MGHEKKAPGAKLYGTNDYEYQYNSKVAELMASAANRFGTIIPHVIFRDGKGIGGAYREAEKLKCDVVIELHYNAFNGIVTGTETLCSPDLNDVEFAHIVQNAVCRLFRRDGLSRGVKAISRSARGGGNVHAFPGGVNCLVEPGFGDSPKDARLLVDYQKEYAQTLVEAVQLWAMKKDMLT